MPVETFAAHNFETTLAENVDGQSLPRAHLIDFGLASCVVLEVTVRRRIQRRRGVGTFAVHNFETTLAENVDGQSLSRAHIIDMGCWTAWCWKCLCADLFSEGDELKPLRSIISRLM